MYSSAHVPWHGLSFASGIVKRVLLWLFVAFLVPGCATSKRGDRPDPAKLHFPTALTVDPAGDFLYVVSTNFDSAYTGGTVVPLDLATGKLVPAGSVEIGSFAGDLALLTGEKRLTGVVAIRDGDRLEQFDISRDAGVPVLTCGKAEDGLQACDADHWIRVAKFQAGDDTVAIPGVDPYAVAVGRGVEGKGGVVYAASIRDGTLSLLKPGDDGKLGVAAAMKLASGLHTIVEKPLDPGKARVFVSNRAVNAIHVVEVSTQDAGATWSMALGASFAIPQVSATGDYFRGIALSGNGRALYAAFRSPPSLAVVDLRDDGTTSLRGLVALHGGPATVAVRPGDGKTGELVYVTDFSDDGLYCVDPVAMSVLDRIPVSDGPYALVIVRNPALGLDRAYYTLFEEDAVGVLDLDPASPTWHQEIGKIQ